MRALRFLLAGFLLLAPLAPFAAAREEGGAACCLMTQNGAPCCPAHSCSFRRCAPPDPAAFVWLPPFVSPNPAAAVRLALSGAWLAGPEPTGIFLPSDIADPPPRA